MTIDIHAEKRFVEIWLESCDEDNAEVQGKVREFTDIFSGKDYYVAVFHSGKGDLLANTELLLLHNKTGQSTDK
ncbi:MAG: hypothetical protein IJ035_07760 [Oscillospiraceae bacterium]|nr:hypothetical protein [Oscillospiraceae bacterium]